MTNSSDEWRHNNIGRLMNVAISHFEEKVLSNLEQEGHERVRPTHLNLTRNLDISGTRSSELAKRAAMTKQAMSDIVASCEAMGLVHRVPDPNDARARIVLFTEKGLTWLSAFKSALQRAENEMRKEIGKQAFETTKVALERYRDLHAVKGNLRS